VEIYNPDDQVASLKNWWRQYGKSLIAGVVIGIVVLSALTYWRQYRTQQGEAASVMYDSLLFDLQQGKRENVQATAAKLMQDFSGTPYAGKAALAAARAAFDSGDLASTHKALEWAVQNARETGVQHSARLRLGRLLLDKREFDSVLKLIEVRDISGFESEYFELRGDSLLAKGERRAAQEAYQQAIDKLPSGSGHGKWLSMKRDNIDVGTAP